MSIVPSSDFVCELRRSATKETFRSFYLRSGLLSQIRAIDISPLRGEKAGITQLTKCSGNLEVCRTFRARA